MSAPCVLITGSGGPLGSNFIRSLRRIDSCPRIVGTDANRWHVPLSLADQTYRIPFARDVDAYRTAIRTVIEREQVSTVIPTHPVEVRAIAGLRDAGDLHGAGTALPASDILQIADDKMATQERLLAAGVAVPRTVMLTDEGALTQAFASLRVDDDPVWVRGSGAPGLGIGGAALPCRDIKVATAWVEHYHGWGRMAASEYLPGVNQSWMALFQGGKLAISGCRERLEYVLPHVSPSGITGAPAVSRTIASSELASLGEAAVRAIDAEPHGVYFVDVKGDRHGGLRVTEINAGRCGTTVEAYSAAGCNFPWLLYSLASGGTVDVAGIGVAPNQYWVRTLDCGPVSVDGDAGFDRYPVLGCDGES